MKTADEEKGKKGRKNSPSSEKKKNGKEEKMKRSKRRKEEKKEVGNACTWRSNGLIVRGGRGVETRGRKRRKEKGAQYGRPFGLVSIHPTTHHSRFGRPSFLPSSTRNNRRF